MHRPSFYKVEVDKIIICRPIGNVEINLSEIICIDHVHHDLLKTVNTGGAFGYFGKYESHFGFVKFYATRKDKMVILTKDDQTKIILTPNDQDEFIKSIKAKSISQ